MVLAASFFASGGLFSQPQLVFVLFAGAVWLIKQINRSKAAGARPASAPQVGGPPEPGGAVATKNTCWLRINSASRLSSPA